MEQELIHEFKTLEAGSAFISKNFLELQKKFPDKFIAIENNKIIVEDSNFESLIDKLKKQNKPINSILIEFIPHSGQIILY